MAAVPEVAELEARYAHIPQPRHATWLGPWLGEGRGRMFRGSVYGPTAPGCSEREEVVSVYGLQRPDGAVTEAKVFVKGSPENPVTPGMALMLGVCLRDPGEELDPELAGLFPYDHDVMAHCLLAAAREACPRCDDDGNVDGGPCMHFNEEEAALTQ